MKNKMLGFFTGLSMVFGVAYAQLVFDPSQIPTITNDMMAQPPEYTIKMNSLGGGNDDIQDRKISDLTEVTSPGAGDFALCEENTGELRRCDIGDFLGSSGLDNVVEDLSPQAGADFEMNGFNLIFNSGGSIDTNGGKNIVFGNIGAPVNYFSLFSSALTYPVKLRASGDDTDIDIELEAKGSGVVRILNSDLDVPQDITVAGAVDGRDISDDGSKLDSHTHLGGSDGNVISHSSLSDITSDAHHAPTLDTGPVVDCPIVGNYVQESDGDCVATPIAGSNPEGTDVVSTGVTAGWVLQADGDNTSSWTAPGSGSGDVVGPASAVDDRIATFDTTTGKLIQDGGSTVADVLARANHTGTQTASTISDFDTEVSNNSSVAANTAKTGVTTEISDVVEDTSPQLGANLDTNGFDIEFDSDKGIYSSGGGKALSFQLSTAGVNYINVLPGIINVSPKFQALGSDTNVDLTLLAKGSGEVIVENSDFNVTGGDILVSGTVDGIDVFTDVTANNAKVSNATHSGDVTGDTVLDIAALAVGEAELALGAVTNGKLGNDAVTAAKIDDGAVGPDALASTAVTPGSCVLCDLTIDADGRITAKANGSGGGGGDVSATGSPLITEYARWTDGTTIEGRTKAQTQADLDVESTVDFDPVGTDNSTDLTLTGAGSYLSLVGATQVLTQDALIATDVTDFDAEVANNSAVAANTAKNTNVSTALSLGTVTPTTVAISSEVTADDVTLPAATTTDAGLLTAALFDEIDANTTHRTSDGSDHSFIDQSVVSGATPTFTNTNFTEATNKNYVTDAEATVIGNTSGANSGDVTKAGAGTYVSLASQVLTVDAIDASDTNLTAGRGLTLSTNDFAADAELYTDVEGFVIETATTASVAYVRAPHALTLTRLDCTATGAVTPSAQVMTLVECTNAGASCATTGLVATVSAKETLVSDTSGTNVTIDSGDFWGIQTTSLTTAASTMHCTATYTRDD